MSNNIHSTGRGGAGNIGPDDSTYVDANIVREGVAGESTRPEFSTGRGGAGNIIDSPRSATPNPPRRSIDVIPEPAMRPADGYENYHTGRGGQGNVHKDKFAGHSKAEGQGVVEKAKHVFGTGGREKKEKEKEKENEGSEFKNESTS